MKNGTNSSGATHGPGEDSTFASGFGLCVAPESLRMHYIFFATVIDRVTDWNGASAASLT